MNNCRDEAYRSAGMVKRPRISVIIPALNEERQLPDLLEFIRRDSGVKRMEVIVVDGKSRDRTTEVAIEGGARVATALEVGRAAQMNIGATMAGGEILYFLHADTYPPSRFGRQILRQVRRGYGAGCFLLGFDEDHRMLRFYSWFTRFDFNAFRFGDQSLFVKQELFWSVGGFDESLFVMEDNDMVYRIKQQTNFKVLPEKVITSARRYRENGVIRLQLVFLFIYFFHHLGISQEVLVDIYQRWID